MTRRILVVDDNRDLAENIGEILAGEGYDVTVCFDPIDAIEHAKRAAFDVAVLDVRMPGMDGVTLHQKLLELRPSATYLLMTAFTQDERIAEALAAGVSAVLPKPVPLAGLLALLPKPTDARQHVLLVDDDPDLCDSLAEALRDSGYGVRCAGTLEQARSQLHDEELIALIADVRLPDGTGTDLAREVCHDLGKTAILITGYDPGEDEQRVAEECAKSTLLTKPFSPETLMSALRRLGVQPDKERSTP